LVAFPEVREKLKASEDHLRKLQWREAAEEASIARGLLFAKLDRFIPKVDDLGLQQANRIPNENACVQGKSSFAYVAEYLDMLRQLASINLARVPLQDYAFLRASLPGATQSLDGSWRPIHAHLEYDEQLCKRAIACLVEISIRIQSAL